MGAVPSNVVCFLVMGFLPGCFFVMCAVHQLYSTINGGSMSIDVIYKLPGFQLCKKAIALQRVNKILTNKFHCAIIDAECMYCPLANMCAYSQILEV